MPGCLDTLAEYLDRNPAVGNIGPRVLNPDMTLQSSCRNFPTLWNNFCSATGLATAFKRSRFFGASTCCSFPMIRRSPSMSSSAVWMLRRNAIRDVGLLDEEFFMYGEDVDWCRRCWNAGWRIVFLPTAEAIHYRGGSSKTQAVRLAVAQQRSILYYWAKHHCVFRLWGIKSILLFSDALRYIRAKLPFNNSQDSALRDTSIACLRALLSWGEPGPNGSSNSD